jgi:O-antigen/teichoic acid export membrane protein
VSFLLLGGSFLAVVAAATLPLGIVMLSQVTRSLAQNGAGRLRVQLNQFTSAMIEVSLFLALQMFVFADRIISIWVGKDFSLAAEIVRIMILAVPSYFLYAGLRSVVDAAAIKAHNTRNIFVSLGVFLVSVVVVIFGGVNHILILPGLALCSVIAMAVLALLTLRTVTALLQSQLQWLRLIPGILSAAALGGISALFHRSGVIQFNFGPLLIYLAAITCAYLAVLWWIKSPWLRFFVETAFPGRALKAQPVG